MGLNVVVAVTEAGMCHLLLFAVDILSEKDRERESIHFIFVSQCQYVILYCLLSENIQTFHTEEFFGTARLHIHIPFLEIMVVFRSK